MLKTLFTTRFNLDSDAKVEASRLIKQAQAEANKAEVALLIAHDKLASAQAEATYTAARLARLQAFVAPMPQNQIEG